MAVQPNARNIFWKKKLKIAFTELDIQFLRMCKKNKVFPKFISIKSRSRNPAAKKAILQAKTTWLNKEIKWKYAHLNRLHLECYNLHLKITRHLENSEYSEWCQFLNKVDVTNSVKCNRKQQIQSRKLSKLIQKQSPPPPRQCNITSNLVKNESSTTFTNEELNLLGKGLKHNLHTTKTAVEDVIAHIESAIQKEDDHIKDYIRNACLLRINRNISQPNHKISDSDLKIVKTLKQKNCYYLKADKGNTVVIMEKQDYYDRVSRLIETGPYLKVTRNPLNKSIADTKLALKSCPNLIDPKLRQNLQNPNPTVPRLYCLPKIHKPGKSVRPIVSAINSPTQKISEWLTQKFKNLDFPSSSITNTSDLVNKIKNLTLKPSQILVSFDVTSLFPSIPIPKAIDVLKTTLQQNQVANSEELVTLTELCMNQTFFSFKNEFFKQTEGTAMGNSLSPFIANLFMSYFEENARQTLPYFPEIWFRYVDDIFAVFDLDKTDLNTFTDQLNSLAPTIKFTVEQETNGTLPFLDLLIIRTQDQKLEFDIYRKPTANHRFIMNSSNHPHQSKLAAFNSMIHRLLTIPLSPDRYNKELNFIKEIAIYNEFDPTLIDRLLYKHKTRNDLAQLTTLTPLRNNPHTYIKLPHHPHLTKGLQSVFTPFNKKIAYSSKNSIGSFLGSPKDPIPPTQKSGIYRLPCDECPASYIGQSRRAIKVRAKEHIAHFKNNRQGRSAVADHIFETGHFIDPNKITLLKPTTWPYLDSHESINIFKHSENLLNNDLGPIPNSPLYSLLK